MSHHDEDLLACFELVNEDEDLTQDYPKYATVAGDLPGEETILFQLNEDRDVVTVDSDGESEDLPPPINKPATPPSPDFLKQADKAFEAAIQGVVGEPALGAKAVNPESETPAVVEEDSDLKGKRKRVEEMEVDGARTSKKVSIGAVGSSAEGSAKMMRFSTTDLLVPGKAGLSSPVVGEVPQRDPVFSVWSEAGVNQKQVLNIFDEDLLSAENVSLLRRPSPTRVARRRLELLRTYSLLGFLEKENPWAELEENKKKVAEMEEVVRSLTSANDELVTDKRELLSDKRSLEEKMEEADRRVKAAEGRVKDDEDWFTKQDDQVTEVLAASSKVRATLTRTEARVAELEDEVKQLKEQKEKLEGMRSKLEALRAEKKRFEEAWSVEKKNLEENFSKLKAQAGTRLKAAEKARAKAVLEKKKANARTARVYLKSFNNVIEQMKVINPGLKTDGSSHRCMVENGVIGEVLKDGM